MRRTTHSLGLAGLFLLLIAQPTVGLDVTLDSGSGSTTLTDVDLDGIIDFDLTVGGVLDARGRVFEQIQANTRIVSITTTPPFVEGFFRNVGLVDATFTITVNSSVFDAVGPPLGWSVFYNGRADDSMAGPLGIPSHSVQALINAGAVSLATLNGPPLVAPSDIDLATSGVNPADAATDLRVIFSFTAGPDDGILLPDNNSVDGNAIQVSVFNQQFKCVDKMNNFSRKVLDKAQKSDAKCVNEGFKAGGADATACVDDPTEEKTEKAEAKLLDQFDMFCAPNLPAWGVNGHRCCEGSANDGDLCLVDSACPGGACVRGACISGAAERAANEVTHGLFAGTVNVAGGDVGKCQKGVIKRAGKLLVERWKIFRKCKKDNFSTIANDTDLVATCLGPPQPDPKSKIANRVTKLSDEVAKCVDKGVSPVGPAFPGDCTGESDGTIATCISQLVSCRFCVAINIADEIVPPLDCDLFDDGASNGSCP
jgi:hypothetical protein